MDKLVAELEALSGPLKGSSIPLSSDRTTIGREPSHAISVVDAGVSRKHCVIVREEGEFKIQDLNSRNSTFVNGVPVIEDGKMTNALPGKVLRGPGYRKAD